MTTVADVDRSFLSRFFGSGWNLVAISVFLFSWWAWGLLAAAILAILFIGIPTVHIRSTFHGSARWAEPQDLEPRGLLASSLTGDRYLLVRWREPVPTSYRAPAFPAKKRGRAHLAITI